MFHSEIYIYVSAQENSRGFYAFNVRDIGKHITSESYIEL
jgi:hypothetical protein